jgi:hypothetical protein
MDALTPNTKRWIKYLVAIVIGNAIYFVLEPHLPPAALHRPYHVDLGLFVDLWFCVAVYGLIELLVFVRQNRRN